MADTLIELKQVYYSYLGKIPALQGIDFTVTAGSKIAIMGANGTGKSTLLMMLDALIFPDRGTMRAFGYAVDEEQANESVFSLLFRSSVGFVFQNPDVQLFCPTVKEDIAFGPLHLGCASGDVRQRVADLAELLRIRHLLDRMPHQLSIGEKKKVAIASVLAIRPQILLLDEPTAGLDPQTTRDIIDILLEQHEQGKTIITATHDTHIVEEIADTVHIFSTDKKIVRSAPVGEVLADSVFLQEHNLIHIHRHRHKDIIHSHPHAHGTEHHQ